MHKNSSFFYSFFASQKGILIHNKLIFIGHIKTTAFDWVEPTNIGIFNPLTHNFLSTSPLQFFFYINWPLCTVIGFFVNGKLKNK